MGLMDEGTHWPKQQRLHQFGRVDLEPTILDDPVLEHDEELLLVDPLPFAVADGQLLSVAAAAAVVGQRLHYCGTRWTCSPRPFDEPLPELALVLCLLVLGNSQEKVSAADTELVHADSFVELDAAAVPAVVAAAAVAADFHRQHDLVVLATPDSLVRFLDSLLQLQQH